MPGRRVQVVRTCSAVILGWVLLGAALRQPILAQDAASGAAIVARLSLLEGEVHITRSGYNSSAVDAALNMPVGGGQTLQTGPNGDAELEFPDGSVLRAMTGSSATLIRLQPQTEIGLDEGLYYLELRAGTDLQFAVYAGELSVTPQENASFRIRVENGQPEIAVLRGVVSVTRANSYTVDLRQGESLRADAKDRRRYLLADTVGPERGDAWNERRAQQLADAAANQTIARDSYAGDQGYGWSDLDSDGSWYALPGEGLVWQPYGVQVSFDPYAYGSWVYGGGGYVWASGYSWGWLPYHCGSWGYYPGFGWGWQPAAGCQNVGAGWQAGGFPVKHPPHDWHRPLPPRLPAPGSIMTRYPTMPVVPPEGAPHLIVRGPRRDRPVQLNGATLRPLAPLAPPPTPHGTSAVGSALRRDFPVQNGTRLPLLGLEHEGVAALPGRAPEWHRPVRTQASTAAQDSGGEVAAGSEKGGGHAPVPDAGAAIVSGGVLVFPAETATHPAFSTGWQHRLPSAPIPGETARPVAGSGIVVAPSLGVRPVPGVALPGVRPLPAPAGTVPYAPTGSRIPVVSLPVRPTPLPAEPPSTMAPAPPQQQFRQPPGSNSPGPGFRGSPAASPIAVRPGVPSMPPRTHP